MIRSFSINILLLWSLLLACPAHAHPHIFIKYNVTITKKSPDTYNLHFTFTVHNVVLNPMFKDKVPPINDLIDALHQHPSYLNLDVNGRSLGQQSLEFTRLGGTDEDPTYVFDTEIPSGLQSFGFSIYDPEYYDTVTLAGADALKVEDKELNCAVTQIEVGKTMWGINRASHVECGIGSAPPVTPKLPKKLPFEETTPNQRVFDNQMLP